MPVQNRICYYCTPQSYTSKEKILRIIFTISLPEGIDLNRLEKIHKKRAKHTQILGVLPY